MESGASATGVNNIIDISKIDSIEMPSAFGEAAIAVWLGRLPLVNIDYSGRALLAVLQEFNQIKSIGCAERFASLERLWPFVSLTAQKGIERHLTDTVFPLTPSVHQFVRRSCQLAMELGRGYQRLVNSDDFSGEWAVEESVRMSVIYRALEAYGSALFYGASSYDPAPAGFWRPVYALYRLAENHGFHREPILGVGADQTSSTIQESFKRIVLFGLANSHRHRPEDIKQIHTVITQAANFAEMQDIPVKQEESAVFFLDLGIDNPPQPIAALAGIKECERRFLFTRAMVLAISRFFAAPEHRRKLHGNALAIATIKRLLGTLGGLEKRKSARFPGSGECALVIGLTSLTQPNDVPGEKPQPAGIAAVQYKGIQWLNIPNFTVEEIDETDHRHSRSARERTANDFGFEPAEPRHSFALQRDIWAEQHKTAPPSADHPQNLSLSAWMLNSSARGYCLLWTDQKASGAQVGELIGIPSETVDPHIGVIRWLSHDSNGDLMLGVELIAPQTSIVDSKLYGRKEQSRKVLFCPGNERLKMPPALLAAPASYVTGQMVSLSDKSGERIYLIEQQIELTAQFQHLSLFEYHDPPAPIVE